MRPARLVGTVLVAVAALAVAPATAHAVDEPVPSAAPASCDRQTLFAVSTGSDGKVGLHRYDTADPAKGEWSETGDITREAPWAKVTYLGVDGIGTKKRLLAMFDTPELRGKVLAFDYDDRYPSTLGAPITVAEGVKDVRSLATTGDGTLWTLSTTGTVHSWTYDPKSKKYEKGAKPAARKQGFVVELIAGDHGTLYARTEGGRILRYTYASEDTLSTLEDTAATTSGNGWTSYASSTGGGWGLIYGRSAVRGKITQFDLDRRGKATALPVPAAAVRIAADPNACGERPAGTSPREDLKLSGPLRQRINQAARSVPVGTLRDEYCNSYGHCWTAREIPWCADFAWWTWVQAGVVGSNDMPRKASWTFRDLPGARVKDKSETPQVGDAVVWARKPTHVGIVIAVSKNGVPLIAEGNYGAGSDWWNHRISHRYVNDYDYLVAPPAQG